MRRLIPKSVRKIFECNSNRKMHCVNAMCHHTEIIRDINAHYNLCAIFGGGAIILMACDLAVELISYCLFICRQCDGATVELDRHNNKGMCVTHTHPQNCPHKNNKMAS